MENIDLKILMKNIENALTMIYINDVSLIKNKVHEINLVFHFCIYLISLINIKDSDIKILKEFNLDIEYNRDNNSNDNIKRDRNHKRAKPDFIIHKRETNQNLAIFEFKSYWNVDDRSDDMNRLIDFTEINGEKKYKYGFMIEFCEKQFVLRTFCNGIEIKE